MALEEYLVKTYDLPNNNNHLITTDLINIHKNFTIYQKNLNNFAKFNKNLTQLEKYILNLETATERYLMLLLSQTHFSNYFFDIYLLINGILSEQNISELNQILLDRLFDSRNKIHDMYEIIIDNFSKILTKNYPLSSKYDLKLFYNNDLIIKFIDTLELIIIKPNYDPKLSEININKLNIIYDEFYIRSIKKLIIFFKELIKTDQLIQTEKYGLSNFNIELYIYYLKYYTGLELKTENDIEYLYDWANEYLELNKKKISTSLKKLYQTDQSNYIDLINKIKTDIEYDFTSEQELIDTYRTTIDSMYNIMDKHSIPNTTKCKFAIFSNKNSAGGFYMNNCFYLNTFNWSQIKKYETRSLVNFSQQKYLNRLYQDIFASYTEGWALFAENIHSNTDLPNKIGQLDSNMLRILRIIADIDIHYKKKSPQDIIKKMSKLFLT